MTGQPSAALALFLAIVLAAAAIHKGVARDRLTAATVRLLALSPALAAPVMMAAAATETAAAIALVLPATRSIGAAIAIAVWSIYALALHAAYRRGDIRLDCGCSFAVAPRGRHMIDRFVRARPIVLALLAVVVALIPAAGIDAVALFAGPALFACHIAAAELAALPSPVRSLLS